MFTVRYVDRMSPHYLQALFGETVIFTCISKTEVIWRFNKRRLPQNTAINRKPGTAIHTLAIIRAKSTNSGLYSCQAEEEQYIIFEDEGILQVTGMNNMLIVKLYGTKSIVLYFYG